MTISPDAQKKRLDRVALAVSLLALVVGGFSFIDNHVTVMPKLTMIGPATSRPIPADPLNVPIWFTITNTGKLDATITEIDATPFSRVLFDKQDDCNKALRDAATIHKTDFGLLGDIQKDHRTYINPYIRLPKICSEIPPEIGVSMVIKYRDFLHIPYTQYEAIRALREKDAGLASAAQ